jgi:hypothetical protein
MLPAARRGRHALTRPKHRVELGGAPDGARGRVVFVEGRAAGRRGRVARNAVKLEDNVSARTLPAAARKQTRAERSAARERERESAMGAQGEAGTGGGGKDELKNEALLSPDADNKRPIIATYRKLHTNRAQRCRTSAVD